MNAYNTGLALTPKMKVTPALSGHVLAEDVYAPQDVPPTPTTNVDGYAVRCRLYFFCLVCTHH
jgi:molybdopterin biosynthesis enzyme